MSASSERIRTIPSANSVQQSYTLALDNADIKELIHWASTIANKNIIVHPEVRGNVTVLASAPFNKEEAMAIFKSVLEVNGLVLLETGDTLKIIPANRSKQSSFPLVDDTKTPYADDIVVHILRIANVPASKVAEVLQPLMSATAHITTYAPTNTLIMSDNAGNIQRLVEIAKRIDKGKRLAVDIVKVEFATASDIHQTLQSIIGQQGDQTGGSLGLVLSVDSRSNSILMSGDAELRRQVRAIIKSLDEPLAGIGNIEVIPINFLDARSIVPILQNIANTQQTSSAPSSEVKIEVSEENNALIITAPPEKLKTLKGIIGKLDVRRAQVLVESIIVEVGMDVSKDLGIEWRSAIPEKGNFIGASTVPAGLAMPVPPAIGNGLTLGFYRDTDLRGFIRALESDAGTNVLSTPTIVTLDNQEAEILVGENVPFITGSATGDGSSVGNPFQTIERHDIGVSLKVKPRINSQNSVTLDITQAVESVSSSPAAGAADLITNKRAIKTRVLIENDEVLVLGGLIRDEVMDVESKVPVLGSIPWLGRLFRSTSTKIVKKNLMVFIHPRVLRDAESNGIETQSRYDDIRKLQQDFNQQSDWYFRSEEAPQLAPRLRPGK